MYGDVKKNTVSFGGAGNHRCNVAAAFADCS